MILKSKQEEMIAFNNLLNIKTRGLLFNSNIKFKTIVYNNRVWFL